MAKYPKPIETLLDCLVKFPGVGRRSAERIVFYLLESSQEDFSSLAAALAYLRSHIHFCKICNNLGDSDICSVCRDSDRDRTQLCIVETPKDVTTIEKTQGFKGLYHVLLGTIAPLEGKGPQDIKIEVLSKRIQECAIKEVIIATDSDVEGETTALYVANSLKPLGVKITRIGVGIPVGSNIEYTDSITLAKALEARREI